MSAEVRDEALLELSLSDARLFVEACNAKRAENDVLFAAAKRPRRRKKAKRRSK